MRWDQSSQKSGEEGRCCPRSRPCGCCCRGPQGEQGLQGERGPQGETGQPGENSVLAVASFFAFERRFENGKPIPLVTGMADETGQIRLVDETRIQLEQGRYAVWYTVSAVLEKEGYFQVTPSQQGSPRLAYGVYAKSAAPLVTAGGANFLLLTGTEPMVLRLHYNSNVTSRSGAASVMVWKLAE